MFLSKNIKFFFKKGTKKVKPFKSVALNVNYDDLKTLPSSPYLPDELNFDDTIDGEYSKEKFEKFKTKLNKMLDKKNKLCKKIGSKRCILEKEYY